ncbi:MAG: XrtA system polysaccharide chain length determinant [Rhodospirillaceae bacterium]
MIADHPDTIQTAVLPYLYELWDRRWLLAAVVWLLALTGWLVVLLLPDVFTVTARVYVDTESVLKPLMRGLTVQGDLEKQLAVMRRTLLARPTMEQVMRTSDLDLRATTPVEREALIDSLQQRIAISTAPTANQLYQITFTDSDAPMAHKVVQSLLNILIEQNVGPQRRDVENARRFVENQLADYEARLRVADTKIANFRRDNASDLASRQDAGNQVAEAETMKHRLESELQATIWRRDQLRLELARTPETLESAAAPRARSSGDEGASGLRLKLTALRATRTDRNPDVIALEREISALEAQGGRGANGREGVSHTANPARTRLAEELKRVDLDVATLEWRTKAAAAEVVDRRHRMEASPEAEQKLTALTRDYDVVRKNYEELVIRRESVRMAQQMENDSASVAFRVIDPPVIPLAPSGPDRVLLSVGVLLAALAAGISFIMLRGITRNALTGLVPLHQAFDLPVLGGITQVRGRMTRLLQPVETGSWVLGWFGLSALFAELIYLQLTVPVHANLVALTTRLVDNLADYSSLANTIVRHLFERL